MRLSPDQVRHVAKLANLPITSQEEEMYSEQLSKILDYIDHLNSVDTSSVEPTFNTTGLSNVMRKDQVKPSISQQEALQNAPETKNGYFVTKGVFEEE